MGGYGYTYESYTTYNTMESRTDEAFGPVIRRSLVPFAPNTNGSSGGYVTKKTIVPVASRPYDDEYKHGSPTKAYPARDDDEWHRQTSPGHGHPQKADEFLNKKRMVPVASKTYGDIGYKQSNPREAYAYPARDDEEWHRQTSPVHGRPQKADEFLNRKRMVPVASKPYGDVGYKQSSPREAYACPARDDEEWHRQTSPVHGRPQKADEFLNKKTMVPVASKSYGDVGYKQSSPREAYAYPARDDEEWHRQKSPVHGRPQKPDEFLTKKPTVPVASRPYSDAGYKYSSPTEAYPVRDEGKWRRQTSPVHARPQKAAEFHNEGSPPRGSGSVISTDWRRPPQSTGYNGDYSNKEGQKPIDRYEPVENFSSMQPNKTNTAGLTRPIISPGWTSSPRNRTQLSEATNDINKFLMEVARLTSSEGDYSNKKSTENGFPNDKYDNYQSRNASGDRPRGAPPSNGPQLSKVDKDKYGETIDSRTAEKKYKGSRV